MKSVMPIPTAMRPKNAASMGKRIAAITRMRAPQSSNRLRNQSMVPPLESVVAAVVEVFPRLTGNEVLAPRTVVSAAVAEPVSTPSCKPTSVPNIGRSQDEKVSSTRSNPGNLPPMNSASARMPQIASVHGLAMVSGICSSAEETAPGASSGTASRATPRASTVK